jgi:hypothetical protein
MSIMSVDSTPFLLYQTTQCSLSLLQAAITSYAVVSIKINVTGMAVAVLKC